jgi:putative oxidoreductase
MDKLYSAAELLGRFLIAGLFLISGLGKIAGFAGTQAYMASMGVPGVLLPLVILTEAGGAIAIILGWKTRWAAFALAGFCVLAATLFHLNPADKGQMTSFLKDIALAGGFLILFAHGAGAWSLDGRKG